MGFRVSDRNLNRRKRVLIRLWWMTRGLKAASILGNQRQLSDGRVMPDGVRQRQHVTAVHLAVTLVAGCEVQQGEGVTCPLHLGRQGWRANHGHDAVVENDPVGLLTEENRSGLREQTGEFIRVKSSVILWMPYLQVVQWSQAQWHSSKLWCSLWEPGAG